MTSQRWVNQIRKKFENVEEIDNLEEDKGNWSICALKIWNEGDSAIEDN